jgi:hypothetical protein
VKQRNIEQSLAAILWEEFCDEIQRECSSPDRLAGRKMTVERFAINIVVTDMTNEDLLRQPYQLGTFTSYQETEKPDAVSTFCVDQISSPSGNMLHYGNPQWKRSLAVNFIIKFIRF